MQPVATIGRVLAEAGEGEEMFMWASLVRIRDRGDVGLWFAFGFILVPRDPRRRE
jgi:hypothetical protein